MPFYFLFFFPLISTLSKHNNSYKGPSHDQHSSMPVSLFCPADGHGKFLKNASIDVLYRTLSYPTRL